MAVSRLKARRLGEVIRQPQSVIVTGARPTDFKCVPFIVIMRR